MIEFKTAVLVGASLKMGGIVAGAPSGCCNNIYDFGRDLGIAFQLQDDYLDAFGDPESFGKQVGGDIIENKKTFLYLTAMAELDTGLSEQLRHLFSINPKDPSEKITTVKQLFKDSGAAQATQKEIEYYTQRAFEKLEKINVPNEKKQVLRDFGKSLMKRKV